MHLAENGWAVVFEHRSGVLEDEQLAAFAIHVEEVNRADALN